MKEMIKHAAVKAKNGMILLGKCHADCFHQGSSIGLEMCSKADHQGFFTNLGRYVDRKEAARIAFEAGQVDKNLMYLFSEDLWSPEENGQFQYDSVKGYFKGDK